MSGRLHVLEQIFHAAMALPPEERRAYLAGCCAGDAHLQSDVESLLEHAGQATAGLHQHVAPVAASLLEPSAPRARFTAGCMLGPYRVERVLGEGGMGVVYLAADTRLGRQVAIKAVGGGSIETLDAAADLLREARAAAALVHPNIAGLYDCGSTDGTPWFVMEYVTGVTLRTVFRPGGLLDPDIIRHATQIAAALEYAHAKQMVHRDIKPDNILLTDEGVIKIIDFGLASVTHGSALSSASPEPMMGTLHYMAPELLQGQTATTAADIYSVGVVLYEMATGEHPFARVPAADLVPRILTGAWENLTLRLPATRRSLASVVTRCMALDPAARYRNGTELSAALAGVTANESVAAAVRSRPRLVILDFVSLTATEGWLGTAIAETVAADLSRLDAVSVATRRRVLQATRGADDPASSATAAIALGRELDAQWIVTGTYQQLGSRIRVTPTLIDASTGAARPAGKVDGCLEAVFELQDQVVATLLDALGIAPASADTGLSPDTRSLLAYEHYARGRQRLYQMQAESLGEAIRHFAQAVAIDKGYALAYAGLGTGHSLQFLRTSNPDDLTRASDYLERATQIDPALGEPYPWLVNTRFRQNNPVGALDAAAKGVALQPDLPDAYYFSGGLHYMMAEHPGCDVRMAPGLLAECLRLQPRFHPAWIVLGATAMFLGQHAAAVTILTGAIALEREPDLAYRFVGAHTLRGAAYARAGDWVSADTALRDALDVLGSCEHVYRDTFRALSCCVLGDVALRTSTPEAALAHYRHARRIVTDAARIAGSARLMIRADAGLAAAYAAAGDRARGRQLVDHATAQLESVAAYTGTTTFECGLGQLCLGLAVAEARLGRMEEAADLMVRARAFGWRDGVWLGIDPELAPLRHHPVAAHVVAELSAEKTPEVRVPAAPR